MASNLLSVVVITKNEVDRMQRLIKSVGFADEIIVVDSGSTDGTQQLCEQLGAKVIHNPWPGYAVQKQFAMEQASCEWILNLDADEEVSTQLADEIKKTLNDPRTDADAFAMPRLSKYLNQWIRHGGWYPDRKIRLVKSKKGKWIGDNLHEKLEVDGKVAQLKAPLLHYVYRDISDQIQTIDKFSDIWAQAQSSKSGFYVVLGLLHVIGKFLECYIWKLGCLDGIAGLVIAMNSAWYIFLKHAKAWEQTLIKNSLSKDT